MARRQTAMAASEAELQCLQGVGNKSDDKTPELGPRRVPSQAGKKRPAQPSCPIEVVSHADRPAAPRSEAAILAAWKGQDKGEHRLRLVHQLFLVTPWCLKTPQRMAALVLLVLVGALMAGLIARQGRRAWAELQQPLKGWRPAGRDSWRPTGPRRCKACAASRLVPVQETCGRGVESRFARLKPVQGHSLELLGLPQPAELCAQPVRVCVGAGEAWVGPRAGTVQGPGGGRTAHGRGVRGGAATAMAGAHAALQRAPIV
jgi:hypothetical protein